MLGGANAGQIGDALRQHADKRSPGRVALAIDGEFILGEMTPVGIDHSVFKCSGPRRHTIVESRIRLRASQRSRAVTVAHRPVFHKLMLVWRDEFALLL